MHDTVSTLIRDKDGFEDLKEVDKTPPTTSIQDKAILDNCVRDQRVDNLGEEV